MLLRCPSGQGAGCFFQKHIEGALPAGVEGVTIAEKGGTGRYISIAGVQGLVSLVQMGALELHGWGARADRVERPDHVVFDLDPAPDVPFSSVVEAAIEVRDLLEGLGLRSFVKTTGGKGLHVEVPIARVHSWEEVKAFSRSVAESLVAQAPGRYVASASKTKRTGKIFVDWLRNGRGATSVVAYSTRARPGATVALPLSWDELDRRLRPERWTLKTVPARVLSRAEDPWKDYGSIGQRIHAGRPEGNGAKGGRKGTKEGS